MKRLLFHLLPICLCLPPSIQSATLTLKDAERLSTKHHPTIAEALAKWNAAEHRAVQAGLRPNPNLVVGTEGTPLNGSPQNGDFLIGVSQRFRLNKAGRLSQQIAEVQRKQAALRFAAAERQVLEGVRGAFATALYAQLSERLLQTRISIRRTNAALVKALVAAGDRVPEDSEIAHAELDHEELDLKTASALKQRAFADLMAAIGHTNLNIEQVEGELAADLALEDLRQANLELDQLPVLLAAGSEAEAMELRARLARASRIPALNLGLMYRRQQRSQRNAIDVEAAISLPLFDNKESAAKAFEEDANAARAKALRLRQSARTSLIRLNSELKTAVTRATHIQDEILPHQQKILDRRRALFEAGESDRLEYEKAKLTFTGEQRHLLEFVHDAHRLWAQLTPFLSK